MEFLLQKTILFLERMLMKVRLHNKFKCVGYCGTVTESVFDRKKLDYARWTDLSGNYDLDGVSYDGVETHV